jgi:hypothetical protein
MATCLVRVLTSSFKDACPTGACHRWILPFSRAFTCMASCFIPLVPWNLKMKLMQRYLIKQYYEPCGLSHWIPSCPAQEMEWVGKSNIDAPLRRRMDLKDGPLVSTMHAVHNQPRCAALRRPVQRRHFQPVTPGHRQDLRGQDHEAGGQARR